MKETDKLYVPMTEEEYKRFKNPYDIKLEDWLDYNNFRKTDEDYFIASDSNRENMIRVFKKGDITIIIKAEGK